MLYPIQTEEKRLIRRRSNLAAVAVMLMLVMTYVLGFGVAILQMFGVDVGLSTYMNGDVLTASDPNRYLVLNLVLYIGMLGVPALVGWLLLGAQQEKLQVYRPLSADRWVGYLMLGMGMCIFANIVAYGTTVVFSLFSLYPSDVPDTADGTLVNWLLSMVGTAVLPAILEELLFRGVVMGLLRPAGDRVAILVSALLFSLAHGTLTQIPFAFVLGLVFGFLYVRTGSLLVPMALHFLNNGMAVTFECLVPVLGEDTVTLIVYLVYAVLALLGAIGAAYLHTRRDRPLQAIGQGASALSYGQRLKAALCAVVMIIVLVWSALQLPMNVEYDPDREQQPGVEDVQPDDGLFAGDGNGESAGVAWN